MRICPIEVTVRDVSEGYLNDDVEGVTGYDGRLDIRPPYQRAFVYKDAKRDAVVDTVLKGAPLSIMYWARRDAADDGEPEFEVLDGQQRTISICDYVEGAFSVDDMTFDNLPEDVREKILDYKLLVYVCEGTASEKLAWFKTINIAGEPLTPQELRNAVYAGPWVSDAKRYFSKPNGPAERLAGDYVEGEAIRQKILETAILWAADAEGIEGADADQTICRYMDRHAQDKSAGALWRYFSNVIEWVEATFPTKRREMRGLPWGYWYNKHKDRTDLDGAENDEAVDKYYEEARVYGDIIKKGVFEYILTGDEKAMVKRAFPEDVKQRVYRKQEGRCAHCGRKFDIKDMQADHITPWSKGGHTIEENCQMLCAKCNNQKKAKSEEPIE